jgi:ATP-dependent DNA helicase RecG
MMPSADGAAAKTMTLDFPVQFLKGVGAKRAEQFAGHGIRTVGDLIENAPFRYEDRTEYRRLESLREGEWVLTRGRICSVGGFEARRRRLSVFEVLVQDGTGNVTLKFFNQPYLGSLYKQGLNLVIYGQVKRDTYAHGGLCFLNPECEVLEDEAAGPSIHSGRVVPVYRKLGQVRTRTLRQILFGAVSSLPPDMTDPLPAYLRRQYRLLPRAKALAQIHFPELRSAAPEARAKEMLMLNQGLSPAHKRLIFEELFQIQVGMGMVRERHARELKERKLRLGENVRRAIKRILPFHPTAAQKRALKEIVDDMCSPGPMTRLLQGEVGSGKTIVAAQAAVIAVENGFQVAFMAPTEILAEQHYFNFRRLLAPLGYPLDILKGSLSAKEKQATAARIRNGASRIAIGTHALIQEGVEFQNLALAVIDEQHRFGVIQRNVLKSKGRLPDLLVMTATPIPRSLALTLYGDLDVSVIDELPPGRIPVETRWYQEKERAKAYQEMRRTVAEGHQVFLVYPLVEETEKSDLRAATQMAAQLQEKIFPDLRIGLLHGKMKSADKDRIMGDFAGGSIQILVATTVVEVGVDVANATLMVIEHAERFGLAQLHQLRGRVGRGTAASQCLLIGNTHGSPEAQKRLEILCETNDGFRIAEVDLELRGPGEVVGTRQSGIPVFRYANLVRDRKALEVAHNEAQQFLRLLKAGADDECRRIAAHIRSQWRDRYNVALAG